MADCKEFVLDMNGAFGSCKNCGEKKFAHSEESAQGEGGRRRASSGRKATGGSIGGGGGGEERKVGQDNENDQDGGKDAGMYDGTSPCGAALDATSMEFASGDQDAKEDGPTVRLPPPLRLVVNCLSGSH